MWAQIIVFFFRENIFHLCAKYSDHGLGVLDYSLLSDNIQQLRA